MHKPTLSTIDNLIGAGGVIQTSPDNITIYNSRVMMRLIGGIAPHDELLAPLDRVLSSFSSWGVEVSTADTWVPLVSYSNTFDVLGTNSSGSFVVRNTELLNGNHSGVLHVAYKATLQGELKWDLEFTPASSAHYRLAYDFYGLETSVSLSASLKKFDMRLESSNYTISWSDVPENFNVTTSLMQGSSHYS